MQARQEQPQQQAARAKKPKQDILFFYANARLFPGKVARGSNYDYAAHEYA